MKGGGGLWGRRRQQCCLGTSAAGGGGALQTPHCCARFQAHVAPTHSHPRSWITNPPQTTALWHLSSNLSRHASAFPFFHRQGSFRAFASAAPALATLRNIGIIAHVDAGKTTTCERMLLHAGVIQRAGDVDKGTTVLDYMKIEQERGITINSAATSFSWKQHRINLIDTPGHVDFTFEVERSVRVLDGAVAVIDGVAGVQAQTQTVWDQAKRYEVPVVGYINKLDRAGASYQDAVNSIQEKLGAVAVPIQLPWDEGPRFDRLVDLVTMELVTWSDSFGLAISRRPLLEPDGPIWAKALKAQEVLIEHLADIDEEILKQFMEQGLAGVSADSIRSAVRKATLARMIVPITCGSSFKYKGVQPLLDAVVDYLPSPGERPAVEAIDDQECVTHFHPNDPSLCALAFKVVHDHNRGPVVYVRLYSGELRAGTTIYNTTQNKKERASRVLSLHGEDMDDMKVVTSGNIAAIVGLKDTRTGDTLLSQPTARRSQLRGMKIPPPVFMCSIETETAGGDKQLWETLQNLQREDPSFTVVRDAETQQLVLAGMGELHLEILDRRLQEHYGMPVEMGKIQISYRTTVAHTTKQTLTKAYTTGGKTVNVNVSVKLTPRKRGQGNDFQNLVSQSELSLVLWQAATNALRTTAISGVYLGFPLEDTEVTLTRLDLDTEATEGIIMSCVAQAIREAVQEAEPRLLEPQMNVEISVPPSDLGLIMADLTHRRAQLQQVNHNVQQCVVLAEIPLKEMLGYANFIRSNTKGNGYFSQHLSRYGDMSSTEMQRVINKLYGR
eukprot:TRINITY_DN2276_c0_g1_i1.p1 TRINITY_DN2276_c0_g1~~TRINITY_DN2276_c0_g1_i1.p1  ORF type:complete len:784 (+),score=92.22 TRINITY_DN2276_c0_g1_i1:44-2395(+)